MKKQCYQCGREFSKPTNQSKKDWKKRKFCSEECVGLWMKGKPARNKNSVENIIDSGKKFRFIKGKKFSKEFKEKMRGRTPWNKGKNVHLSPRTEFKKGSIPWNKGLGNKNEINRIKQSKEYREWRKIVMSERKYTCERCKEQGGRLQIHHVEMICVSPERIMDKKNVILVCYKCHRLIHKHEQPVNQFLKEKYLAAKTLGHVHLKEDSKS